MNKREILSRYIKNLIRGDIALRLTPLAGSPVTLRDWGLRWMLSGWFYPATNIGYICLFGRVAFLKFERVSQ